MKQFLFKLILSTIFAALLTSAGFAQQTVEDYFKLGNQQLDQKKYAEAANSFGECLRLSPKEVACYRNRGIARFLGVGFGLALEDYNMALSLEPNNASVYFLRGQVQDALKNSDAAIADYSQAIKLKPDYPAAYSGRANVYRNRGNDDLAIADFTQAIKYNPNYYFAINSRGQLYQKKGNHEAAIADFTTALQVKPDYASALYYRGKSYREQGKRDLSDADFDRASVLDDTFATLVKSLRTREKSQEALAKLDQTAGKNNSANSPATNQPANASIDNNQPSVSSAKPIGDDSTYQKALSAANSQNNPSQYRAQALKKYLDSLENTRMSETELNKFVADKLAKLIEVDFYAAFLVQSLPPPFEFIKWHEVLPLLPAEQVAAFKKLRQWSANSAKTPYPSDLPKPGHGWKK